MFKFLNRKHYSSTMCEMWYFLVQPEFIKNQESWIFQIIHCFRYIGWAKQKAIKKGNDPEQVNSENKHFRERMLFSRLDDEKLELRTEHRVLCDEGNFMLNHEWLNISTSLRNDNDLQARSKHKMTGGAERVAHINSPPPASVPRLKHTSWYMSDHYILSTISDQLKKAYAKASALRRIRRFLPHDAMIKLYKAFILPHLEYCSPLFVGMGTGQRNRIEDGNCYMLRTLIGHNKSM